MDNRFDEFAGRCETCKNATALNVTGDYLCEKHGVVKSNHVCKKYMFNESMYGSPKSSIIGGVYMPLGVIEEKKLYEKYDTNTATINPAQVKKMNRAFTPLGKIASILLILICVFAIWQFTLRMEYWYFLGGIMFAFLAIKDVFALFYVPCKKELTKEYKVSVILTCFNEDPASIVSIFKNVLALDYPVHEIIFLDDGSADPLAFKVAKSFAEDHQDNLNNTKFKILRFEENRGKREVMIDGFLQSSGDYFFMLDSDSKILPNALTELLRPFEKKKTTSVVGDIGILNRKENFLTMLQSISYFGAFQFGRAAQSVTGDVVVCSGAFSVHKKDFIMENLEKFRESTPFGIHVSAGDDRSLTILSKMSGGKTRYQSTAYCETIAPNTWKKFQKQRRRWQRSGYICSLEAIKDTFPKHLWYSFWAFNEVYLWLIATVIFIVSIITRGLYINWIDVVLYFIIITYKHNIFYSLYRPIRFLLVPLYFLVYGFSLTFTRIHAALTITNDDWGTRGGKEEQKEQEI